ncbi:MAG: AmmeMemoRadiSam system radical SAM enzyme [Coriobacteriales bacterium]
MNAVCDICPHGCSLAPGAFGLCGARRNDGGCVVSVSHGAVTSIALDPIEKKPLARYRPGSYVLSVGSFGCNLSCPFCQNHEIATARGERGLRISDRIEPAELADLADELRERGNIGIAYTYNEPFVGWEFLRDTMPLVRERGLANVVVTNGYINEQPLLELLPFIDALNIDLKGFSQRFYDMVGAPRGLETVKRTIELASRSAHVEVTTLVIPGENDSPEEMEAEAAWLASIDPEICLHITRFFPRHRMLDKPPTPIATLEKLAKVARGHLPHVVLGNV